MCQGTDDVSWHAEAEVAHDLKQVIIKMRAQPNVTQVWGGGRGCRGLHDVSNIGYPKRVCVWALGSAWGVQSTEKVAVVVGRGRVVVWCVSGLRFRP